METERTRTTIENSTDLEDAQLNNPVCYLWPSHMHVIYLAAGNVVHNPRKLVFATCKWEVSVNP